MDDYFDMHKKEFGDNPILSVDVPQPTVLVGQFSDLLISQSLICLTDDGLKLSFSPRQDNIIRIVNTVKQDKKKFNYPNVKYRREDRWANAIKAVMYELAQKNIKFKGYNILLTGRGAGADSWSLTASLYAGILIALNDLEKLKLTRRDMMEIALEANSFSLSYQARKRDLWSLFFAKEGMVYLWSEKDESAKELPFSVGKYKAYILSSSLPYSVLTPEEDEFRRKAKGVMDKMVSKGITLSDIRHLSEKEARTMASRYPDTERRCLTHLVIENENTQRASECVTRGDVLGLGKNLFSLQRSLAENAELTSPELDWIWRRGQESDGVLGMDSIGVGIAGSFFAIVDDSASSLYAQKAEEYERIFGFKSTIRPFAPLKTPDCTRY